SQKQLPLSDVERTACGTPSHFTFYLAQLAAPGCSLCNSHGRLRLTMRNDRAGAYQYGKFIVMEDVSEDSGNGSIISQWGIRINELIA
ncbi:hypothetical protein, partial [Modicisalibacter luteus]|uniref:hypothetical protein n=1 Tax=Modicisalibacter luteus TaxID=453962 RepID=UPI001B7FBE95